jgi:molecular chaperone GrpE (heat shock protein)
MANRSTPVGDSESAPGEPRRGLNLLPAAELAAEIERLKKHLSQEHDKLIRALADFTNYRSRQERCPEELRRIEVWDEENQQSLVFLTNHLTLGASTIAV